MRKHLRITLLILLAVAMVAPSALAQVSRTTGALIGTVTDGTGAPLPGVSVTISSPSLQGTRTEVTDTDGSYVLPLIPPGTYTMEFTLEGVPTAKREHIVVNLGQTTKTNVTMKLEVTESITVTADEIVIDPTQTTTQTNFKENHLKFAVIGAGNRSYQNVVQQAPGVAGGGNPNVMGANLAQNNYTLDGVNTTDPVVHTFGNNLAFDALKEISIQTLGKGVEYGGSGGTISVITKSGGNNFSGSFDWRYNDTDLQTAGKDRHPVGFAFFGANPTGTALNFDKSLQKRKFSEMQGTVGGPVMRDRLWFFLALSHPDTATTPPKLFNFTPGTRGFKGWSNLGKMTFTPVANQTVVFSVIDSYASLPHIQNSSYVSPEAGGLQTQGSRTYALNYDGVLSSQWLVNAQVGHTPARLGRFPISGNDAPGTYNYDTAVSSGNYTTIEDRNSTRDEIVGSTTYYLQNFGGTHALKVGVDLQRTEFDTFLNLSGDPTQIPGWDPSFCSPQYGVPAGFGCAAWIGTYEGGQLIAVNVVRPRYEVSSSSGAYYIQDEWNPISRLTVRAGLRYETMKFDTQGNTNPPDFSKLQPRLGFAYDVFNNANSVIHAFIGRVMDDNQLTLPEFGVALPTGQNYFYLTGDGTYEWDGVNYISESGGIYDPDLKPSYSNQYSVGYTHRVWRNTSVDVTLNYRNQKDLFEDYWDGTNEKYLMTNQPGADVGVKDVLRSTYRGISTKVESRPYKWLDLIASWTYAKSKGSTESIFNQDASFDFYPVHFDNRYGYLSDDARNRVKIDGYAHLPLDFTLGLNYYWDDGRPWSVFQTGSVTSVTGVSIPYGSYFIESRGSRRLPSFSQTDIQLQKDFRISNVKVGLIGTVFNLFNTETVTGINGNAGSRAIADSNGRLLVIENQQTGANRLSSTFGQPTSWQRPRLYEVGIRFEF